MRTAPIWRPALDWNVSRRVGGFVGNWPPATPKITGPAGSDGCGAERGAGAARPELPAEEATTARAATAPTIIDERRVRRPADGLMHPLFASGVVGPCISMHGTPNPRPAFQEGGPAAFRTAFRTLRPSLVGPVVPAVVSYRPWEAC